MENNMKDSLFENHIEKIKHSVGYQINETPKYRALVNDSEEFDDVPNPNATQDGQPMPTGQNLRMTEAGDQEDVPKPEGAVPPAPSNDLPIEDNGTPPDPNLGGEGVPEDDPTMSTDLEDGEVVVPEENPQQEVDDIQNEIIKHNIVAMKDIHDQLEGMNQLVQGLNNKMDELTDDVEEVREPTNSEKLMNKTDVSYPYYFNLNDFWKDNWFDQKNVGEGQDKGIRELPDGTYIAEFDDLPQKSKIDIQNSFNELS